MNNYCGFIEVWKFEGDKNKNYLGKLLSIDNLEDAIKESINCECETIAVFKIRLK